MIKRQTGKMLLAGLIEIGRRLVEAKGLFKHGEWIQWLEESVSYSKSTAQNLMRLYEEYGKVQPSITGAQAQAQTLPDLNYTQALLLLGVPEEEREQLINGLDIDSMSTRELKKALEARKQALRDKEQAERERAELQQAFEAEKEKNTRLAGEQDKLKQKTEELQKSKHELEQQVQSKTLENKRLTESSNYKSYQRVSNQLTALEIKVYTGKIAYRLESLTKLYKELGYEMNVLLKQDKAVHDEYAKMLNQFLLSAVKERMGRVIALPQENPEDEVPEKADEALS